MIEKMIKLGTVENVKNFVNEITKVDADVDIASGRYIIDAKSIMGLYSLDLSKSVKLIAHSEDEATLKKIEEICAQFQ